MIDLRSDTVTRPSTKMLEAMMNAKVGDDVFGDDPSVKYLERFAAQMFGMEAAVYCPSGTMTNQIAIKAHTRPGDEVICDRESHIYNYEGGGIALNSGCSVRLLDGNRGRFNAEDVRMNINDRSNEHFAYSKLVAVENTCNRGGGSCYDYRELEKIAKLCKSEDLLFHLDGARLFNALVKSKENPKLYGSLFDSISICLSKGLGAPVGSLLLGDAKFILYARRFRKAFGGGMRQAGYLAAAGLYALENNIDRLVEDHHKAEYLEKVLTSLPFVDTVSPVETNIIVFSLKDGINKQKILDALEKEDIGMVDFGNKDIRAVTHLDITDMMLDKVVSTLTDMGKQAEKDWLK